MSENIMTGENCFFCGQPRWSDDEAYGVTLYMGAYVSDCGCGVRN